jgi:hypothetical protein
MLKMYSMEDRAAFHIFFWRARLGRRDIDCARDIDYASVNLNLGNHRPGGTIHPNE